MAAGGAVCQYNRIDSVQENVESGQGEVGSLHERLVAYVHTLDHGSRRGVWNEHSYARARLPGERGAASPSQRARALLAPRPHLPAPDVIDVVTPPSPRPVLPLPRVEQEPAEMETDEPEEDDWEARVTALAPTPSHATLADAVADTLRSMRLARLTSGGGGRAKGEARAAARSLRRALAPVWLVGGPAKAAPGWLHAALQAYLPRSLRRLYEEAVGELRRSVPRLAERLTSSWAPPPVSSSSMILGPNVGPDCEPWLVWVPSGNASLDARWEGKLATQIHTRVLRPAPQPAAAPEAWCAATAGAVREQLTDALAEAGDRSIILGGIGAGAAICLLLARGAGGAGAAGGVRGAVLAAPALRTAEGGRGARDDALSAVRLPLLMVVGTHAQNSTRAIANEVCERGGGGAGTRRVLEVHGADSALRLTRRQRRRLALPQTALDVALVEECVRWAIETAEGEPTPEPPSPPPPRRHQLPAIVKQIAVKRLLLNHTHVAWQADWRVQYGMLIHGKTLLPIFGRYPSAGSYSIHGHERRDFNADDEYAHLPTSASTPVSSPSTNNPQTPRSIELVEGRVVSRAAGGTPLTLLPPRRAPPSPAPPAPPAHSAVDIMQMPIVFADDNPTDSSSGGSPVTVTSGKARGNSSTAPVKLTRVILAKRGAGRGGAVAAGRGRGGVYMQRGVRILSRQEN